MKWEVSKVSIPVFDLEESINFYNFILGNDIETKINDVKADLFDENTVYVALDNHKNGDYTPYLVKSTDKGATWKSITNGLTTKNMVWRIVQDHVKKELFFLGKPFFVNSFHESKNSLPLRKGKENKNPT